MWRDLLHEHSVSIALWGGIGLVLLAMGVYIIRRFPRGEVDDNPITSDMMSTFRDLHAEGELSEEEYRKIKTKLAARLKYELFGEASDDDQDADSTEYTP